MYTPTVGGWTGSTYTVPLNAWSLFVVTYDGHYWRVWDNGTLEWSLATSGDSSTGDFVLGGGDHSTGGRFDEVRIYPNRNLTETDITALMNFVPAGAPLAAQPKVIMINPKNSTFNYATPNNLMPYNFTIFGGNSSYYYNASLNGNLVTTNGYALNNTQVNLQLLTAVGSNNFTVTAKDNTNSYTTTNSTDFTVTKYDISANMTLTGNTSSTVTYPTATSVTGAATPAAPDVQGDFSYGLYRNGNSIATGNPATDSNLLRAATHVYVYNLTAQNYTGSATYTLTVNQGALSLSISNNASSSINYPTASSITGSGCTFGAGYGTDVTCTLYRGNSSFSATGNNAADNILLGAGTYAYNYSASGGANWTAASASNYTLTVVPATLAWTLTSSAGWSLSASTQTTVSCSMTGNYLPNPVTLANNGITVSNPYTATLGFGSYNFYCSIPDTQNYTNPSITNILNVVTGGTGCLNTTNYIYQYNLTTNAPQEVLNFTGLVAQNIVNPTLSDVNISAANPFTVSVFLNSSAEYLILNTTNNTLTTINFANAFATPISYSNTSFVNSTIINFNYTQVSSDWYFVNLINEINGTAFYPLPNATGNAITQLSLYCTNGQGLYNITRASFDFPALQQLTATRVTVTYTPTSVYYRDLLVMSPIQYLNFYVIDATNYQVVQYLMQLQDNSGHYPVGSILSVERLLGNNLVTITQLAFDVQNQAIVYLQNGGSYFVYVSNPAQTSTKAIGNMVVDNVNLIKTIVIAPTINTGVQVGNVSYSMTFNNATGVINFNWFDPYNNTGQINMSVYNGTSGSLLAFFSQNNCDSCNYVYTTPNASQLYLVNISAFNNVFGDQPLVQTWFFQGVNAIAGALPGLVNVLPQSVVAFAAALLIITVPMFFDEFNGALGGVMAVITAVGMAYMGWWTLLPVPLAAAMILAGLNMLTKNRRGDE